MANGVMVSCRTTLSYPKLHTAKLRKNAKPGQKPKFGGLFLVTPEDVESPEYKSMVAACVDAVKEKWGADAAAMLKDEVVDLPLKRDIASQGFPSQFARYFNAEANEDYPPTLLGPNGKPLADKREWYPGAIVRISYTIYAYGGKGTDYKPGMRFGLRNAQKLADGPRLTGADDGSELGAVAGAETAGDGDDMAALMA